MRESCVDEAPQMEDAGVKAALGGVSSGLYGSADAHPLERRVSPNNLRGERQRTAARDACARRAGSRRESEIPRGCGLRSGIPAGPPQDIGQKDAPPRGPYQNALLAQYLRHPRRNDGSRGSSQNVSGRRQALGNRVQTIVEKQETEMPAHRAASMAKHASIPVFTLP